MIVSVNVCFVFIVFGKTRIVYPRVIESRSTGNQLRVLVTEGITLSLEPADIFPDKFLLQYHVGETPVNKYIKGAELRTMVYHDKDQNSAVSIDKEHGM
ncbi:unnamed protein product, partial [Ixodes hexagonus]